MHQWCNQYSLRCEGELHSIWVIGVIWHNWIPNIFKWWLYHHDRRSHTSKLHLNENILAFHWIMSYKMPSVRNQLQWSQFGITEKWIMFADTKSLSVARSWIVFAIWLRREITSQLHISWSFSLCSSLGICVKLQKCSVVSWYANKWHWFVGTETYYIIIAGWFSY